MQDSLNFQLSTNKKLITEIFNVNTSEIQRNY